MVIKTAESVTYRVVTFPFVIVAVIIDVYLLFDGKALFGLQFVNYEPDIELYLGMLAIVFVVSRSYNIPELKLGLGDLGLGFVPAFLATGLLLGNIEKVNVLNAVSLGPGYLVLQILYEIFVVAFTEETVFRGILMPVFQKQGLPAPWLIQGIAFGLFHYAAYSTQFGFSWSSIFVAIIFGSIMGLIVILFQSRGNASMGIAVTIGIHAAWNLALTTGLFSVGGII